MVFSSPLEAALENFAQAEKFHGKGPLCVALVVTEHARRKGLPLKSEDLETDSGGQVKGLGRNAVQAILRRHGIQKLLATEGGRTSRGSLGKMRLYISFLNRICQEEWADLDDIESFWIAQVKRFFAGTPFSLSLDASCALRPMVRDIVEQATSRQESSTGVKVVGAVLHHLTGAKLDCALGSGKLIHRSFSTADAVEGHPGDFTVGDAAIHVTTYLGEAVIGKCMENLAQGVRPILVTLRRGVTVAEELAKNQNVADRIDVFEIEQFIALNLYEWGQFSATGNESAVEKLVERYNQIVETVETDPSLKIRIRQ